MRRLQIRNVQARPMPWFDEEANRKGNLITNSQHRARMNPGSTHPIDD